MNITSDEQSGALDRLQARVADELARQASVVPGPGLFLVPTPIGNLGDATLRSLATLARVDAIACEDTRHSGKLLSHYGIKQRLISFHDHNEAREADRLIERMKSGDAIALISDAGMPLISDPGFKLVSRCWEAGVPVTALPGPSAPVTALAASGLAIDRFLFAGFLPSKEKARAETLTELADLRATLVFFESPQRLPATLAACLQILGDRPVAIAREISKLHETVWTGRLPEAVAAFAGGVKGELVICIGPGTPEAATDDDLRDWLATQDAAAPVKDLARQAADRFGVPRKRAYEIAVALRSG